MTAIILAAGVGKRMGADAPPKCLQRVGEKSLLQRTLESLKSAGVLRVVLVVGYRADDLIAEARKHASGMTLVPLVNSRFREGAILSLWTAREALETDVIVMDADVLFPPSFMELLVNSSHANCLLVDGSSADTGEEQVVMGQGDRVLHITKRPSEELRSRMVSFGESIGFLKLSQPAAQALRSLLETRVASGIVDIEHEQVYPELFQSFSVGIEKVDGQPWMEIDTPDDLQYAQRHVYPKWSVPPCLNRALSNFFLPAILPLPVTPNQWTTLSFLVGLFAVGSIASGDPVSCAWGALLFQLSYLIDNWDGDVARAKGLSSKWGGWYDVAADAILHSILPLAIAAGMVRSGFPEQIRTVAAFASAGVSLSFLCTLWAKSKGFGIAIHGDPARMHAAGVGPAWRRWVRINMTNENFSLVVAVVLLADLRLPFLWMTAVGSQIFWVHYLWRERSRLFTASPRPAGNRRTY